MTIEEYQKRKAEDPDFEYNFSRQDSNQAKENFLKNRTETIMTSTNPEDLIREQFETNSSVWQVANNNSSK